MSSSFGLLCPHRFILAAEVDAEAHSMVNGLSTQVASVGGLECDQLPIQALLVEGCQLCAEERASRCRVITGPDDERLKAPRFQEAVVIVANNDAKYQINKDRAKRYARDAGAELRWAIAKDVAGAEVLQAQPCDKDRKIKSLGSDSIFLAWNFYMF